MKYLIDIHGLSKLQNLNDYIYIDDDGEMAVILATGEKTDPILRVGGGSRIMLDHAQRRHVGTTLHTSDSGLVSNPMQKFPSAPFFPIPEYLTSLFTGVTPFIENPMLMVGLMAIILLLKREEDKATYTHNYKVMSQLVVDNEELERELFGENW